MTTDADRRFVASAPGRICLAGESLDWMIAGPSVTAAIPLRTTVEVACEEADAGIVWLKAREPVNLSRVVRLSSLGDYPGDPIDLMQACAYVLSHHNVAALSGSVITARTRAPVGAGVSSSAALSVAACAAILLAAVERIPTTSAVAHAAHSAETGEVGTGAGWMDFLACAHGGVDYVQDATTCVRLRDEIDCPVVLIDTLDRRTTARTLSSKHARFAAGDARMRTYAREAPGLVDALVDVLSTDKVDHARIGAVMTHAQHLLRDLVDCSTPLIDECVSRCLAAGAYGAKVTGSGHGGCLFALCPLEAVAAVSASVADLPVRVSVLTRTDPQGVVFMPPTR